MRSLCLSTAMTLSNDVSKISPLMRRRKAGQTSRDFFADRPGVQQSCRFRRRDDAKTRHLHRRHTCTSDCHDSIFLFVSGLTSSDSMKCISCNLNTQKSNIARRSSSGRSSIVNTRPTSHRISQQALGDDASAQQGLTSIVGMCEIVCHPRAFEIPIYWDQRSWEAKK